MKARERIERLKQIATNFDECNDPAFADDVRQAATLIEGVLALADEMREDAIIFRQHKYDIAAEKIEGYDNRIRQLAGEIS